MTKRVENEAELGHLAESIGKLLKKGDVLALRGDLGAGKTAFARALIRSLTSPDEDVPSPTFTLVQVYDLPQISLWHFDLYRLEEEEKDVLELGWEEALRHGAALVEWPDRLGGLLPKDRLEINISFVKGSDTARDVSLSGFGSWPARLKGLKGM